MSIAELMGTRVELAAPDFDLTTPLVDRELPGGWGHLLADPSHAIMRVHGVGTFAVAEGSRIRFEPEPDVPPDTVSVWLHGTVAALLLAQRGRFALHASVVEIDGVGVAVAGSSGAGKSTTALRLMQRGHALVTDDVSPLDVAGPVITYPFARPVHVFPQTAALLGIDVSTARPILRALPKVALPVPSRAPVPLSAVAVLEVADAGTPIDAVRVRGAQSHWLLGLHLYRVELLGDIYRAAMFQWAGAIARKVPVHALNRPVAGWTVDAVADEVERIAENHGRH